MTILVGMRLRIATRSGADVLVDGAALPHDEDVLALEDAHGGQRVGDLHGHGGDLARRSLSQVPAARPEPGAARRPDPRATQMLHNCDTPVRGPDASLRRHRSGRPPGGPRRIRRGIPVATPPTRRPVGARDEDFLMPVALPEGSWALILGGSSGFGLATAHQLSRHGVHLCLVHRDRRGAMPRIQPEFDAIRERGVSLLTFNDDALSRERRGAILDQLAPALGERGRGAPAAPLDRLRQPQARRAGGEARGDGARGPRRGARHRRGAARPRRSTACSRRARTRSPA